MCGTLGSFFKSRIKNTSKIDKFVDNCNENVGDLEKDHQRLKIDVTKLLEDYALGRLACYCDAGLGERKVKPLCPCKREEIDILLAVRLQKEHQHSTRGGIVTNSPFFY